MQRLGANAGPALPFAGIAPQSGQLNRQPPRSAAGPFNLNQPAQGARHVAQLSIHGTADRTIAYGGGRGAGLQALRFPTSRNTCLFRCKCTCK